MEKNDVVLIQNLMLMESTKWRQEQFHNDDDGIGLILQAKEQDARPVDRHFRLVERTEDLVGPMGFSTHRPGNLGSCMEIWDICLLRCPDLVFLEYYPELMIEFLADTFKLLKQLPNFKNDFTGLPTRMMSKIGFTSA